MALEVEAKFLADGPWSLDVLASAPTIAGAHLGPARTVDETDRYLDTADGRIGASRWACRLRSREGRVVVSLKGPAEGPSGSWLHHRPEVEGPATASLDPRDWPRSDARALLDRLRGDAPLVESFRLEQRRTERRVEIDGRGLGTLSLDRAAVHRDGRTAGELFVVELELDAAPAGDALDRLAAALRLTPGLRPDPKTKLEHALELLAG